MLAGASLVGQVAAVGHAARGAGAPIDAGSGAAGSSRTAVADGSAVAGATSPRAPRCTSVALGSDEARYLAVRFLIAPV